MQTIKLTEELRLKLLDLYMAGKIDLQGYTAGRINMRDGTVVSESKLIAVSVHVSRRDCMSYSLVTRLICAKHIELLEGVSL